MCNFVMKLSRDPTAFPICWAHCSERYSQNSETGLILERAPFNPHSSTQKFGICNRITYFPTTGLVFRLNLPSSPACDFEGILFILLGVRGAGLVLLVCFEISFIGILLRTSRPPKDPELFVPCKSLSMKEKQVYTFFSYLIASKEAKY